jgi:hypothetical protein
LLQLCTAQQGGEGDEMQRLDDTALFQAMLEKQDRDVEKLVKELKDSGDVEQLASGYLNFYYMFRYVALDGDQALFDIIRSLSKLELLRDN